jgi:hypothetical protein
VRGFLGEDGVLLEDAPTAVALLAQVPDDRSDIDIPAAERAVHAVTDRLGVSARPDCTWRARPRSTSFMWVGDSARTCQVRSAGSVPPMRR